MYSETGKSNKPCLTDRIYLQKIIADKKMIDRVQIQAQSGQITEPTFIDKLIDKIKSNIYLFVENNIFIIILLIFVICFLIYRYLNRSKNSDEYISEHYYGADYSSPFLNKYNEDEIKNEHSEHLGRKKLKKNKLSLEHIPEDPEQYQEQYQEQDQEQGQEQYQNQEQIQDQNDIQHEQTVPELLKITNDRNLTYDNINLSLINSSSYAPFNLKTLTNLYPWNNTQDYKLT